MRLVRFGEKGKERPGVLNQENVFALDALFPGLPDLGPEFLGQGWVEKARQADLSQAPAIKLSETRLGSALAPGGKIICLGKNYADHAKEGGMSVPEKPLLFCKTPNTVNGPNDPVLMPRSSGQVDWEVELAVVIGKTTKGVSAREALDRVAGFCVMNDVSAREAQFSDKQWFRGKSFDTFAPLGPALVTPDEVEDVNALSLTTLVNGQVMQEATTADLIFKIPFLIEYISADITLEPGDIISTGTPSGVGIFRDPPVTLSPGDVVECRISGLGSLVNRFVEA